MTKTRALILAAGLNSKWDDYLGVPKHLIPIKDTPLIHRTIKKLAWLGVEDIRVVCWPAQVESYIIEPATHVMPQKVDRYFVHEQEQSRIFWNTEGRTIILYGDTYYTNEILMAMVDDPADDWHVYGRMDGSKITKKHWGEMWGWVFKPEHHQAIDAARNVAIAYTENGLWFRCLGWELYRIANQFLPWDHQREDVHFIEWSDATEDFDTKDDYEGWIEGNRSRA